MLSVRGLTTLTGSNRYFLTQQIARVEQSILGAIPRPSTKGILKHARCYDQLRPLLGSILRCLGTFRMGFSSYAAEATQRWGYVSGTRRS